MGRGSRMRADREIIRPERQDDRPGEQHCSDWRKPGTKNDSSPGCLLCAGTGLCVLPHGSSQHVSFILASLCLFAVRREGGRRPDEPTGCKRISGKFFRTRLERKTWPHEGAIRQAKSPRSRPGWPDRKKNRCKPRGRHPCWPVPDQPRPPAVAPRARAANELCLGLRCSSAQVVAE